MAGSFGGAVKLTGETEYRRALGLITNNLKVLSSEMKVVSSQYDSSDKSAKKFTQENEVLSKEIEAQKNKVNVLSKALADAEKETGKNSVTAQKWQTELNNAQAELNKLEKQLKEVPEASKGLSKVTDNLADFEKRLKDLKADSPFTKLGNDVKDFTTQFQKTISAIPGAKQLGSALSAVADAGTKVAKVSFKAFAVGIGAVSAGLVKLGSDAISAYADTEQLRGGVETLFKSASDTVIKNANNAFKTAGMSANEYMENVTSFSASLISSVGGDTAKAAKIADQAIIDMSDNANKMGTDISSIQNAYQGFAKGNYTMLDNLKLGYGGTKTEMERLLADAEKLTGKKFDISNFADITEAIHAIQTQYDITGTTAKEASSTIQGSISATKSAYQNLLAGLADENADLDQLLKNMLESVFTVADNLMPRVSSFLTNVTTAIRDYAPEMINELVSGVAENLSPMVEAATGILSALVTSLTDETNLGLIIGAAVDLVLQLVDGLVNNLEPLIDGAFTIVTSLTSALLEDDNLTKLIEAAVEFVTTITTGLLDHIPELVDAGLQLVGGLIKGLWDNRSKIWDSIKKIASQLIQTAKNALGVHSPSTLFADIGKNLIQGLVNGIGNAAQWVYDKIRGLGHSIIEIAKSVLGIHSPSTEFDKLGNFTGVGYGNGLVRSLQAVTKRMKDEIGGNLAHGLGTGFTDAMSNVSEQMRKSVPSSFNTDVNFNARGANFTGATMSGREISFNMTFNIDGSFDKSNINELADTIADRMYRVTRSKLEAYA